MFRFVNIAERICEGGLTMAEYIDIDGRVVVTDTRGRELETTVRHILEMNKGVYTVADVRPVVTCSDCKWWAKQEASLQGRCELLQMYPTGAWFCANGKREES